MMSGKYKPKNRKKDLINTNFFGKPYSLSPCQNIFNLEGISTTKYLINITFHGSSMVKKKKKCLAVLVP